jgi:heat shock protein HslJ
VVAKANSGARARWPRAAPDRLEARMAPEGREERVDAQEYGEGVSCRGPLLEPRETGVDLPQGGQDGATLAGRDEGRLRDRVQLRQPTASFFGPSRARRCPGHVGPHDGAPGRALHRALEGRLGGHDLAQEGPGGSGAEEAQGNLALVGSWRAVSLEAAGGPAVVVDEPQSFTAEFRADGTLHLRADCNVCACGYTAGPGSLTTTPMACTLAACASAPRDTQFAGLVSSATSWTVAGDRLDLTSTAGVVRLQR